MRFTLRGARLVDASTDLATGEVTVNAGALAEITKSVSDTGSGAIAIDVNDMIITPGFLDIHTHGGSGFNLHTHDPAEIAAYAEWAPSTGVTSFLVAVVGVSDGLPESQLQAAVDACEQPVAGGAEPVGIFLEGPYLSNIRRGAHRPSWLRQPDIDEVERLLTLTAGHLRLMTIAPELSGAAPVIRRLVKAGITVSLGHSDATYEQALDAMRLGVTHMTHCCNAMRPLLHREPGPLGALVDAPHVMGELIADGVHVHPAMAAVVSRILGPARTIIITDAQAGAGSYRATFAFAGQPTHVEQGASRLADGTLAGSVLTMDQALRNTLQMTRATLAEAVGMMTLNPARAIHLNNRKGRLRPGYDADLLLFSPDLTLQATFCRGHLTYATDRWLARLASLRS